MEPRRPRRRRFFRIDATGCSLRRVPCEHALLTLLDALELQRSLLCDGARETDACPRRAAFEALERVAVTEANRLTGDCAVPALGR